MNQQNNIETIVCPCDKQSCNHSQDTIEAAETLLVLSRQPPRKFDERELDAAVGLLALSQYEPEPETPNSDVTYEEYRLQALEKLSRASGGQIVKDNPKMSRKYGGKRVRKNSPKYEAYLKNRLRNNRSAKNSRDRQRTREVENKIKTEFYAVDNELWKARLAESRSEIRVLSEVIESYQRHLDSH